MNNNCFPLLHVWKREKLEIGKMLTDSKAFMQISTIRQYRSFFFIELLASFLRIENIVPPRSLTQSVLVTEKIRKKHIQPGCLQKPKGESNRTDTNKEI